MGQKGERDYRLDFCRGLALIVIFIDHVPGNPLGNWTLKNFAFCDAAEVFVLISGISSYLAYGRKLDQLGFLATSRIIGRRWLKVYLAHLLLFASLAGAVAYASHYAAHGDYVNYLGLGWLFKAPGQAAVAAVTLRYLPKLMDILPLYLVLLALAPGLIYLVKRDARLALAVSASIYVAVRLTGFNLSSGVDGLGWCFNPFAWQLLYTVGIVIGHLNHSAPGALRHNERWLAAALAFIGFAFVAAAPWSGLPNGLGFFNPPMYLWPAERTFLAPLRVVNVLALLYVFTFFVARDCPIFRSRLAAPLLSCGRNSLAVFGVGVVLSSCGYIAITESGGAFAAHAAVNAVGILALFVLAGVLDWWYRGARSGPAATAVPRYTKLRPETRSYSAAT
jgi:hypothetical protein